MNTHVSPQPIVAGAHDVETHEKISGGVHGDAGAEVLAPDAEKIGETTIDKGSGIIDRRVGGHEQAGDDAIR